MAVSTKMAVFWVVAPCSLVEVYQRFRGPCCLHYQPWSALISLLPTKVSAEGHLRIKSLFNNRNKICIKDFGVKISQKWQWLIGILQECSKWRMFVFRILEKSFTWIINVAFPIRVDCHSCYTYNKTKIALLKINIHVIIFTTCIIEYKLLFFAGCKQYLIRRGFISIWIWNEHWKPK
jgi:hypothetical protein